FDMHQAEDVGLLKIDILGQRSLTVISDTLAAVRQNHDVALDFSRAPADDAPTWRNIQEGRTIGCFQVESPGMRSLLRKLVPRDMETIIAASSVIRPGPSDAGMLREFIARYHGTRPTTYLHPAMEKLLGTTLGIMVYQEDILRVAHAIAGISPGEADKLRRAMSSKRSAEAMQAMKATFIAKAEGRGVPADSAREIWRQMESFSGYAFCKAHSSSYAVLSWQAAYLKTHFPAEFFAAVISNGGGFYSRAAYVLEARRWGVPVRLPDINRSDYLCTAEGPAVRLGLGLVGKLSRAAADRMLAARGQRLFTSFTDFLHRAAPDRDETEALIRCGAMDGFEFSRPELLWRLELLFEPVRRAQANPAAVGLPFPELAEPLFPPVILPRLPDFTPAEKLRQEAEVLEAFVSDHPLALHRQELAHLGLDRAADLPRRKNRSVRLAGWPVTSRRVFAKNRQYMKFLTLEDETDIFEVVLFPAAYRRWGHFTTQPGPFVVEGKVTEEFNSFVVDARRLMPLRHYGPAADGAAEAALVLPHPRLSD
ncbi:MAG: DNA polymerase III subunit alpha, partial [Acidobacteria bacterium]|nr:DNA polymerase III subunit alpha [Acidobacteriota bacterium]